MWPSMPDSRADLQTWAGDVKKVKQGKVAVFTNPIDTAQTETKGTVLIKSADDMLNFTREEEKHMEKVCILEARISVIRSLLV